MIDMPDKISYYNLAPLKNTIHDDNDFLILMLEIFIESNTVSLLNLSLAVKENNWKAAGEGAHKMLSSFKHLEIDEALPDLIWLEKLIWHEQPQTEVLTRFDHIKSFSENIFSMLQEDIKLLRNG